MRSCTSKVETGNTFQLGDKMVTLVDTPGFDDTTVSDTDILKMISVYLSSTWVVFFFPRRLTYLSLATDTKPASS